ncbi:MAG: Zn-dependent hydrolase [Saprospiraceae bacterium]|nr:Zn-dependent hydrolase [Saprospiraceae bacterium]
MTLKSFLFLSLVWFALPSCKNEQNVLSTGETSKQEQPHDYYKFEGVPIDKMDSLLMQYRLYALETDLSTLTPNEQKMIPILIEAASIVDELFWIQSYGDKNALLKNLNDKEKAFALVNYGPWERLNGNAPLLTDAQKPLGANFYPADMTDKEFEMWPDTNKSSQYTMVRRGKDGKLMAIPYHEFFAEPLKRASFLLEQAAALADDDGLQKYLLLRSKALIIDDFRPSDMAWLDMKSNKIDLVIGPIENYEDQRYGFKTSYEAYVLIKDLEWSRKLEKFKAFLPDLQRGLPVGPAYKTEAPGTDTELNAYDVIQYKGDCNAGSKTIAINLPNDEVVQLEKGTRRLQLKNVMEQKFKEILVPIATELLDTNLMKHVNFGAFFENTMFHEVAHGLGIKNTVNGKGLVRTALKEHYAAIEEGKADILGLYMIDYLASRNEIQGSMEDYITTFFASIFRSVRFGVGSAHGKANMIRFNYLMDQGAIYRNSDGRYGIHFEKFRKSMSSMSALIRTIQGDGNYDKAAALIRDKAVISSQLAADLDKLTKKNIAVDLVFKQ